jgi:hypothetical protein
LKNHNISYHEVHENGHGDSSYHGSSAGHNHYTIGCPDNATMYTIDPNVQQYWCKEPTLVNGIVVDGEYNQGKYHVVASDICVLCDAADVSSPQ